MAGTRYLRYILLSVICIIAIIYISSSSNAGGQAIDIVRTGVGRGKLPFLTGASSPKATSPSDSLSAQSPEKDVESGQNGRPKSPPTQPSYNVLDTASNALVGAAPQASPKGSVGLSSNHGVRENATFVTLARNSDIWEISQSIRMVEDRFNHQFNYDWVFLNDEAFDEDFRKLTTAMVSGTARYGVIPTEHWSFPEWIDQDKAAEVREDMKQRGIIYGDSISYRHMCRYESGFFFRHPLMNEYKYYWRVEPSIKMFCDVKYDVFKFMREQKKKYSFVISLKEYPTTIETLWDSVKSFIKSHPEHLHKNNALGFVSEDGGDTYNLCHFWSNFEVGDLDWLRSQAYLDYFEQLDQDGGFFYERWGDAPVHSIAASLLLDQNEIQHFEDIGYWHVPFHHCPNSEKLRLENACNCNPDDNFDWNGYSCTARFFDVTNQKKPEGSPTSWHVSFVFVAVGVFFMGVVLMVVVIIARGIRGHR